MQSFSMKQAICLFFLIFNLSISYAGTILVTNVLSNSVSLIDENTLNIVKNIPVGFRPHEVEVTPNGRLALVSNYGTLIKFIPGQTLSIIDVANASLIGTVDLEKGARPHGIHFLSNQAALVTAQGIQSLLLVDIEQQKVLKSLKLPGKGAHMVRADQENRFAYVTNTESGTLLKIDLRTFTVMTEVKIGKSVEGITLNNDQSIILVTNRKENFVAVLRTKDLAMIKRVDTNKGPVRIAMINNGEGALVTNCQSKESQVIDMTTLEIRQTFATTYTRSHTNGNILGSLLPVPESIYVNPDQQTAYITHLFAGNITLVNLLNGEVLKTFEAGKMPDGLMVTPVNVL